MNMNKSSPMFSIVLPTYNREKFLTETINSVIKQSFKNWELIIIDDGSTDNTKKEIEKIVNNDSRIKYFFRKIRKEALLEIMASRNQMENGYVFLIVMTIMNPIIYTNYP